MLNEKRMHDDEKKNHVSCWINNIAYRCGMDKPDSINGIGIERYLFGIWKFK